MKLIACLALCLGLGLTSFGQNVVPNAKVAGTYSLEELQSKSDAEIAKLNFLANHLCIIQDANEKTAPLSELNLVNPDGTSLSEDVTTETFNPLLYGIEPQEQNQYFSIANGTKSLFVYSSARIDVLFARQQTNQK